MPGPACACVLGQDLEVGLEKHQLSNEITCNFYAVYMYIQFMDQCSHWSD